MGDQQELGDLARQLSEVLTIPTEAASSDDLSTYVARAESDSYRLEHSVTPQGQDSEGGQHVLERVELSRKNGTGQDDVWHADAYDSENDGTSYTVSFYGNREHVQSYADRATRANRGHFDRLVAAFRAHIDLVSDPTFIAAENDARDPLPPNERFDVVLEEARKEELEGLPAFIQAFYSL